MATGLTIQIQGFDALQRRLSDMPTKIENKCYRQALRATANVAKGRIKPATPFRSGEARRLLKVKTRVRRGRAWATVRYTRRPSFYMRIFEHGSSRQPARPFFMAALGNFEAEANGLFLAALKAAVERNEG